MNVKLRVKDGLIICLLVGGLVACNKEDANKKAQFAAAPTGVIYGNDSRQEASKVNSSLVQRLSQVSVALIEKKDLRPLSHGIVQIQGEPLTKWQNFCANEPFIHQRAPAFCSGILFRGKYVLTAGHCMSEITSCSQTAFIFGFQMPALGSAWNYQIPLKQVFNCKRIVARHLVQSSQPDETDSQMRVEFSIVELDRPVMNQGPMLVGTGELQPGSPVFVLGYPAGLPQKYADGLVLKNKPNVAYFKTNLDTYAGNSGSPVFNINGGLEGLLIRGNNDFDMTPAGCIASVRCLNHGNNCDGERIVKAPLIRRFLGAQFF